MDINFELYKIFYHSAKYQSFSDAASALFISQSAVSQSIKNLEDKIGCLLFYRKTRSVQLTREGEMLFKHIEQAYNFIKTAEEKIFEMQNLKSGEVKIGTSDTVCKYYLIPYLEKFNRAYPKIKIQVINRTSSQIIQILKKGLIDLGIVTLPLQDKNIRVADFTEVEDIWVACNKFSNLKDKTWTLNQLQEYSFLMLEKNSTTRQNLDRFFKEQGIEILPEIELESIDLLIEFAKIGLGIAHVLKESTLSAMEASELFEVKIKEKSPIRKLGIITMDNVPLSKASSQFIRFLSDTGTP